MAPLSNHTSKLKIGKRWDDGFVNQRLLGLGVASGAVGAVLGLRQVVVMLMG